MTGKFRTAFTLLAATVFVVSGCSSAATSSVPSSTPATSSAATSTPATSSAPSATPLKIGVVTDVGRVDDKNFNQYSYEGAKAAAAALGTTAEYVVPKDQTDYAKDIQGFLDKNYN